MSEDIKTLAAMLVSAVIIGGLLAYGAERLRDVTTDDSSYSKCIVN